MATNKNVRLGPSEDLAYIVGVYLSDGWVYAHKHQYCIGLESASLEYAERFLKAAQGVGLNTSTIGRRQAPKNPDWKHLFRVQLGSKALYDYLRPLKEDPQRVVGLVREYSWKFLSGFFDGDGTVNNLSNGYRVLYFMGTNKAIMDFIAETLGYQGFNPKRYVEERGPTPLVESGCTVYKVALTSKFEIETFLREAKPLKGGDA
jgi:intein-encoded DNA endonuclease-like protein